MKMTKHTETMPGPLAPAFSVPCRTLTAFLALAFWVAIYPNEATAQAGPAQILQPTVQPPASVRPTPGQLELSKLIWSTIAAVDHGNRSGNYSVLRDISAQGFQINNNAAQLSQIFAGLRESNIDLANAFLVPPTYTEAPTLLREDVFRVKGIFQLRPISIGFDMYFQWEQGRWKLFGIDIQPLQMQERPPE